MTKKATGNKGDKLMAEKDMCRRCNRNEAESSHDCPYQVEMAYSFEKDDLSLCNCCDECTSNCAADI